MSEDIERVIVHSKKRRDIALNGVIRLEENIADLEEKLVLTDGDRVTLEYVANKLQMYDAQFHEHHYKLVDPSMVWWNSRHNKESSMTMNVIT